MLTRIELLSPAERERLVAAVHALEARWIPRPTHRSGFFTLGAASYLDDDPAYRRTAAVYNPLLEQHFGPLLDRVRSELARHLGAPVRFDDRLARPGFHIWRPPAIFTAPTASIHFDLQYQQLAWPANSTPDSTPDSAPGSAPASAPTSAPDQARQISFTLPLRLPRRGGGLHMWSFTYEQVCAFHAQTGARMSPADLAALEAPVHHPYCPGVLVVHSGHRLHQIAPVADVAPDDERITLQGHARRCAGEWRLYW